MSPFAEGARNGDLEGSQTGESLLGRVYSGCYLMAGDRTAVHEHAGSPLMSRAPDALPLRRLDGHVRTLGNCGGSLSRLVRLTGARAQNPRTLIILASLPLLPSGLHGKRISHRQIVKKCSNINPAGRNAARKPDTRLHGHARDRDGGQRRPRSIAIVREALQDFMLIHRRMVRPRTDSRKLNPARWQIQNRHDPVNRTRFLPLLG